MTTLTRAFWEKHFPADPVAFQVAGRLTGLNLMSGSITTRGLKWLADQTEEQAKPRWSDDAPEWMKTEGGNDWPVSMRGLQYKPWSNYLTLEGWPTGTTCWYVCVEAGWRQYAASEHIEVALCRGLILFAVAKAQRDIAPSKRSKLQDALIESIGAVPA